MKTKVALKKVVSKISNYRLIDAIVDCAINNSRETPESEGGNTVEMAIESIPCAFQACLDDYKMNGDIYTFATKEDSQLIEKTVRESWS